MITNNITEINGKTFYRTVSDTYKIRKQGTQEVYDEAFDLSPTEYEETDILLDDDITDSEALEIILGGQEL